jgi:acetyl-CoA acetyltransferase
MEEVVIVSGARTAVGEFGGSLKGVRVVDMGALVIKRPSNGPAAACHNGIPQELPSQALRRFRQDRNQQAL